MDQHLVICAHRGDIPLHYLKTVGVTDYIDDGPRTVVFNSLITSQTIPILLVDDSIFEFTEFLQARLSFPGDAPEQVILNPGITNVTILDDDSELSLKLIFIHFYSLFSLINFVS